MIQPIKSDSNPDDAASSVVELTKDSDSLSKELLKNTHYHLKTNYYSTKPLEEEQEDDKIVKTMMDEKVKIGTILSSSLNLSNTVIGAGILGIPLAIKNTGFLLGAVLFALFAILATFTLHLYAITSLCVEYSSYDSLCEVTIPRLKKVTDFVIGFACWGVTVAYLVVIGDAMDLAMEQFLGSTNLQVTDENLYNVLINRYFWMILYLFVFIIPTISLKKMDSLKFTSFFALFAFVVLMMMIILYWLLDHLDACPNDEKCHDGVTAIPNDWVEWLSFFRSAPIFIFAYECHPNLFPIRNEMKMATIQKLNRVSIYTVAFCTVIYALVGYAAYLTYGDNVDGNILNNYPQTTIIGIVRVGLTFAITFSYPVAAFPARECFFTLLFCKDATKVSKCVFYGVTYGMALVSLLFAIILDDLEIVLSILGSIGATAMVFILPGLFYYYLGNNPILTASPYHNIKRKLSVLMVIIGFLFGILGLFTVILEYV